MNYVCRYLISDETKNKVLIKRDKEDVLNKFDGRYESFYFPPAYDINVGSRSRATNQVYVSPEGHLIQQSAEKSKLPPVKKPRFLEILESRINKEKAKFRVVEGKPDPLRLQIYREIFTIFIQTCVYYGPLLARIKAEYESYLVHVQDQLKKLQPIRELLWTVSQECENRVSDMRRRENKDIKKLKQEKKALLTQISNLYEKGKSLSVEVDHLTTELEKKADDWRTESDGRKLLVSEVNELTSRLKEMETLARAEVIDDSEDPIKLRLALDQAHKTINQLQTQVVEFEARYEAQVSRTKYEEVRKNLASQIEENLRLKEELESTQSRYDLLQEHCVTLNTYRDLYYIQVTYASRIVATKGEPAQKVDVLSAILNKWRRITADKPWAEVQRMVADEILRLESGQLPSTVRTSRAPRHRPTMTPGSGQDPPTTNTRDSIHRSDAA
ncbi:Translin-associated factor X-interacting protein 1 [Fasciola gigantica]|uniref:Translin-associated factor X-interacting protein 1 n=1 Tax=Fasciola gigantica TaxID=46835 RepID=A0A504YXX0_FASGI|nr:Translin-associated factor X-interacting protein 1 [Fasciola gigantica]